MSKKSTLKGELLRNFWLIMGVSIFTILFINWGLFYFLKQQHWIFPHDYAERQLPAIQKYLKEVGVSLLDQKAAKALEEKIPEAVMSYAVCEVSGKVIYGSIKELSKFDQAVLKSRIPQENQNGLMRMTFPIMKQAELRGFLFLKYLRVNTTINPRLNFLVSDFFMTLILPFLEIFLLSLLLVQRFSKKLLKPIQELSLAVARIKRQELDFQIKSEAANELGDLASAFEEMRVALQSSLKQQWQLEHERREMVAALAHDLRNPLTIIKGHLEVLQGSGTKNQARVEKYLEIIMRNNERASELVNEMNLLSKVEAVNFVLEPTLTRLSDFFGEKVLEWQILCEPKQLSLQADLIGINPAQRMRLDQEQVGRVLDNLIVNSLRFTPEGGRIELVVWLDLDELCCRVQDHGMGFSDQAESHLFQKFYQGDQTSHVEKDHLGLGLYLCKCLVAKHGGKIMAGNAPNGGAVVDFSVREIKEI